MFSKDILWRVIGHMNKLVGLWATIVLAKLRGKMKRSIWPWSWGSKRRKRGERRVNYSSVLVKIILNLKLEIYDL